jgi:uncharacterized protein YqfA (UPF0365 family)
VHGDSVNPLDLQGYIEMNFADSLFITPNSNMEGLETTDGVVPQPVVAIYVPAVDGEVNPLIDMDINGAHVDYREWQGHTTLEGMQQVDQQLAVNALTAAQAATIDADLRDATHVDYNLFVIDPAIQPSWYESLGEVKDLTGVLLTGHQSEYNVKALVKLETAIGMENIFTSVGQACVRIERVLRRK